MMTIED